MAEDGKSGKTAKVDVRALSADDLEAVIAIDAKLAGQSRRGFFERRLRGALSYPEGFIFLGADVNDALAGFALVRVLAGEFGGDHKIAVMDAIGVDPDAQGRGLARALMAGIDRIMAKKGIAELQTQAEWTNHDLLMFLDAAGFERAPRVILHRDTVERLDA